METKWRGLVKKSFPSYRKPSQFEPDARYNLLLNIIRRGDRVVYCASLEN